MRHDVGCEVDEVNMHIAFFGDEGEPRDLTSFFITKNRALCNFVRFKCGINE